MDLDELQTQMRVLSQAQEKVRKRKAEQEQIARNRGRALLAANLREAQRTIARIAIRDGFELSPDLEIPESELPKRKIRYSEIGGQRKTQKRYRSTWRSMLRRCYNSKDKAFPRYGGRGIQVCKAWRENFDAWLADMGECPKGKTSIDRKNNSAHYSCGKCSECIANSWAANCVWADHWEQRNNQGDKRLKSLANLWRDIQNLSNGG